MEIKIDNLDIRDYFAGQALVGILSNSSDEFMSMTSDDIAELSYDIANEMLKEKEKINDRKSN